MLEVYSNRQYQDLMYNGTLLIRSPTGHQKIGLINGVAVLARKCQISEFKG